MNPPVYEELLSIPTTTSTLHLTNLSTLAAEPAPPPFNWLFYTGTYGVSATLLGRIFDSLNDTLYDFNIGSGVFWSIAFEPLPTAITKVSVLEVIYSPARLFRELQDIIHLLIAQSL